MKKILFGVIATAALLTACDPAKDDISWNGDTISADVLANGITIKQYGGDKAACDYSSVADGNWIEFATNPSKVVRVYYKKADGSAIDLSVGRANGLFYLKPSRGSASTQTLYFETLEFDGSSVTATKDINVQVATALTLEQVLLCSNKGTKAWKWDFDMLGACWGNLGADATHSGNNIEGAGFKWWGVDDPSQLSEQAKHAVSGDFKPGEADYEATMVFTEDGIVFCYDRHGNEIRKGSFEVKNFDPTFTKDAWKEGTLSTSEGATLFPYEINGGGKFVTEYEIHKLTASQMILVYPDGGVWDGTWKEATYWCFKSDADPEGMLADNIWTWDFDMLGTCWGNMGADGSHSGNNIEGAGFKWWGVDDASQLSGQTNHVAGDVVPGEFDNNATMIFDNEGSVSCFDANGEEIRKGTYEINGWDPLFPDAWKCGILKTSEGATLFPYEINAGGKFVTEFEIHKLSPSQMILAYPDGGVWDGTWKEATYWCFKRK